MRGEPSGYLRTDAGAYRLIYRIEGDTLELTLIGKRNDTEAYWQFERLR